MSEPAKEAHVFKNTVDDAKFIILAAVLGAMERGIELPIIAQAFRELSNHEIWGEPAPKLKVVRPRKRGPRDRQLSLPLKYFLRYCR